MEKLKPYARIIRVAKKPNMQEFRVLLKVTGLGVILIGIIGFAIHMGRTLLF